MGQHDRGQPGPGPGAAVLHLTEGVRLLHPEEQVFQAMLDGWRNQQLARNLAFSTIATKERLVRRFRAYTGADPWQWMRRPTSRSSPPSCGPSRAPATARCWPTRTRCGCSWPT